jgi:hypothetical protein
MFSHTLFRVHTYIYFCASISFSFPILWFVNFVDFFHFLIILIITNSHYWNKISQFLQKKLCSHSAKNHQEKALLCTEFLLFFHSRFFCYDRPVTFPSPPNLSHWPGRTSTYTGTLTFSRKASQRLSLSIQRLWFCLRASPPQKCKQLLYAKIE